MAIAEIVTVQQAPDPIRNYRYEHVRVADLKIDPSYHAAERFSERHARRLGAFDESKVGVITVSLRGDTMWLLDGNHRRWIATNAGVSMLYAKVFFGLTQQAEAAVFHGLSRQLGLLGLDLWQTRRVERDPVVIGVEAVLARHGVRIVRGQSGRSNTTRSIVILEKIFLASPDLLDEVISLIQAAWPNEDHAFDAIPIQAISSFVYAYQRTNPPFKPERLKERLAAVSPHALMRATSAQMAASAGRFGTGASNSRSSGMRDSILGWSYPRNAFLAIYNAGLRNRLQPLTLSDMKAFKEGQIVDMRGRA